jgi:catechol 2,3-dioxygenase-like lactoylglutathione lyase family enzyme
MIPVTGLNHAVLYVRELNRSVGFYKSVFAVISGVLATMEPANQSMLKLQMGWSLKLPGKFPENTGENLKIGQ